ncbi:uncharacterized protein PFL1_01395 [Pseudozyma flocculosa PF-1]|uniref:uncharacterized protein n=1 Tax=Pseudozyma flocculosa PF-1 TaxID=1277687 RepID=UPI0004560FAF|nr:uncharacterized protein PFL1_01395 [Pseudozyma flocculosa PF-1]EPQ31208.1 hypothetical protein PFL1_01395 [Pseudozyma flocculosa PF-1]
MDDPDEGDSCRICRCPAEPDQPLYHPCKCAGSIRFCHQDCLVEWLKHSRKKYCELCHHSFVFHKRYRSDMPADGRLPSYLYLRRSLRQSADLVLLAGRALLVAFTWLGVLPLININVWRFLFWFADVAAWLAVSELSPLGPFGRGVDAPAPAWASSAAAGRNSTSAPVGAGSSAPSAHTASSAGQAAGHGFAQLLTKPKLKAFAKSLAQDCFEGQIVTCVIVVAFVAIFLLREWILQNAPQQLDAIAPQVGGGLDQGGRVPGPPDPRRAAALTARAQQLERDLTAVEAEQIAVEQMPNDTLEARRAAQARAGHVCLRLAQISEDVDEVVDELNALLGRPRDEEQRQLRARRVAHLRSYSQRIERMDRLEADMDRLEAEQQALERMPLGTVEEIGRALAAQAALGLELQRIKNDNRELRAEHDARLLAARATLAQSTSGGPASDSNPAGEGGAVPEGTESGEEQPKTAEELRRIRLRRFEPTAAPGPATPALTSVDAKVEGVAGPGFRFDFDTAEVEDDSSSGRKAAAAPLAPEERASHPAAVDAGGSPSWPSWGGSTESSTPSRNSIIMTDGNAASLSVPSWQEGSSSQASPPAEADVDGLNGSASLGPSAPRADKGKARALDDDAADGQAEESTAEVKGAADAAVSAEAVEAAPDGAPNTASGSSPTGAKSGLESTAALDAKASTMEATRKVEPAAAGTGEGQQGKTAATKSSEPDVAATSDDAAVAQEGEAGSTEHVDTQTAVATPDAAVPGPQTTPVAAAADAAAEGDSVEGGMPETVAADDDDPVEVALRQAAANAAANANIVAIADAEVRPRANAEVQPRANANAGADDDTDDDDNDDEDDLDDAADDDNVGLFLDEEIDSFMEALGMRGPMFALVQNLLLMVVVCNFAILFFVAVPFFVGKVLGPGTRLLTLAALPVKLLRHVTDPVFDAIIRLASQHVWPWLSSLRSAASSSSSLASATGGSPASTSALRFLWGHSDSGSTAATSSGQGWLGSVVQRLCSTPVAPSDVAAILHRYQADVKIALRAGAAWPLEALGTLFWDAVQKVDLKTMSSSSSDRALCVGLGHAYCLAALGIYKRVARPGASSPLQQQHLQQQHLQQQPAAEEPALRLIVDQLLLILKVVGFLFVELVFFPLGCGLLLDVCLMPLFGDPTPSGWLERARFAPFAFGFTRWMGGTVYMFLFAQYVHTTRGVLRPGVLCWIRDPNDPGFHPIKDILSKPTLTQLRKIGASAVMYAGILVASVGFNTYFLRYALGSTGVLPLRWKPLEPLSEVPFDLLAVHLVVPWLGAKLDGEAAFSGALRWWWTSAARAMRLSTYLVGGDHPEERGHHVARTWTAWLLQRRANRIGVAAMATVAAQRGFVPGDDKGDGAGDGQLFGQPPVIDRQAGVDFYLDGGYCRVPGDDKAVTTGPLIIPVKPDGSALDERGAEAIHQQEEAARGKTPKPSYVTLYMPPHFRPHDFYAFCLGSAAVVAPIWLARGMCRLYRRAKLRAAAADSQPKASRPLAFVAVSLARRTARLGRVAVLGLGLGVVVPLMVGMTINQYLIVPLRFARDAVPEVDVWQTWALGLVECKLALKALESRPAPAWRPLKRVVDGYNSVRAGGLRRPAIVRAYRDVVLPIAGGCQMLLLLPVLVADVALRLLAYAGQQRRGAGAAPVERTAAEEQAALRIVYGVVLCLFAAIQARNAVRRRMAAWTDVLKDEEFLESTELKNYQPPAFTARQARAWDRDSVARASDSPSPSSSPSSSAPPSPQLDAADADASASAPGGSQYEAEGPLPDVLLR